MPCNLRYNLVFYHVQYRHEIPVKNVKPHPSNPPRSWTTARGGFKGASNYHQKYGNGAPNGGKIFSVVFYIQIVK